MVEDLKLWMRTNIALCYAQTGTLPSYEDWKEHIESEEFINRFGVFDLGTIINLLAQN